MRIIDRRQARTLRRNQRPMWLPIGPLLNPGADERFLFRPEMLVRLDRRHPVAFFLAENPRHKLAVLHVARYDRLQARVGLAECAFLLVQPKTALALRFVRPMAGKALVGEDRPDVRVVADFCGRIAPGNRAFPTDASTHDNHRE